MDERPSRRAKYFTWIMISLVSFFFAEVISGSSMIRSFEPGALATSLLWSLIITIPLYGLHTLILATIIYRFSKPRLYTLFFAGVVFALYEAYITKVLWVGWGSDTIWYAGGIAVVETAILLLFWHPFMAFIIPLFASESLLTRSREVLAGLPRPLKRLFTSRKRTYGALLLFGLLCGINQAGLSPSPLHAIASNLLAFAIFTPLLYLYRRHDLHRYDIRQLLPDRREFVVLLAWLSLIYLVFGIGIRPETLRNLLPQVIVWLLYVIFLVLLYFGIKKSKHLEMPGTGFPIRFSWRLYGAFFFLITFVSALISLAPFRVIITMLGLLIGTATGLIMLALAVQDTRKRN
jgi:hypothetical protein